jgi:hypothetical protein
LLCKINEMNTGNGNNKNHPTKLVSSALYLYIFNNSLKRKSSRTYGTIWPKTETVKTLHNINFCPSAESHWD